MKRLLPCDVLKSPQLPIVTVLRAAATATIPVLLHAHPAVAADRLSTTTEIAAEQVVRLAERLRTAIDNYRHVLHDDGDF